MSKMSGNNLSSEVFVGKVAKKPSTVKLNHKQNDLEKKEPLIRPKLKSQITLPNASVNTKVQHKSANNCDHMPDNSSINMCRDFEEQGVCLRGEMCPLDHGTDPVVFDDITVLNNVWNRLGTRDFMQRPRGPFFPVGPRPPVIGDEYFPENPGFQPSNGWSLPQFRHRPVRSGFRCMPRGREGPLFFHPPYHGPDPPVRQVGPPPPSHQLGVFRDPFPGIRHCIRGGFNQIRSPGFGHGRPSTNRHRFNCCLEVRKIPREQNNIMELNNHFSKFGKILNILITYDNDPEAALITFNSPFEAQQAYRSTEAVLNNRFIKVFWHNGAELKKEVNRSSDLVSYGESPTNRIPVKERLGPRLSSVPFAGVGQLPDSDLDNAISPTSQDDVVAKKLKTLHQDGLSVNSLEAMKKNLELQMSQNYMGEEMKQEAFRLSNHLRNGLQTLMDEQISNQKKLVAKLESKNLTPEEREATLDLLRALQESVTKLSKHLNSEIL